MIRTASLAALCAFGLSNVAHASLAVTQMGTTDVVANFTTLGSDARALEFRAPSVLSGSDGVSLSGGAQAITTITNPSGGSGSLQIAAPGGSVSLTDLNFNTISGSLYSQIRDGGNVTLTPGAITVTSPLITNGDGSGSGSTLIVGSPTPSPIETTPTPAPVEPVAPPLPMDGVIPPALPLPEPVYLQQAGMACSGAFSVTFGAQTTVNCMADLWFTKGFVAANQSIVANALGNILVDDVSFVAPNMQFNAGANFVTSINPIWFDGNTTINALGVNIAGQLLTKGTGSLTINSQTINFNPAIPEPSTWALMGLGLVGLRLAARRKA